MWFDRYCQDDTWLDRLECMPAVELLSRHCQPRMVCRVEARPLARFLGGRGSEIPNLAATFEVQCWMDRSHPLASQKQLGRVEASLDLPILEVEHRLECKWIGR